MPSKTRAEQERDLTESLEETFPASDATSSNEPDETPVRPAHRRPPLIDEKLVQDLADEVAKDQRHS